MITTTFGAGIVVTAATLAGAALVGAIVSMVSGGTARPVSGEHSAPPEPDEVREEETYAEAA